jgi:hypothetical protein
MDAINSYGGIECQHEAEKPVQQPELHSGTAL